MKEYTNRAVQERPGSNLSSVKPAPASYEEWIEFARTASHGWHEEETKYPYNNPHYDAAWGHFSQMVWRNSTRIGCAVGHCDDTVLWPGRFVCCMLQSKISSPKVFMTDFFTQTMNFSAIILLPDSSRSRSGALSAPILLSSTLR